jgi:hypothetical protein
MLFYFYFYLEFKILSCLIYYFRNYNNLNTRWIGLERKIRNKLYGPSFNLDPSY